MAARTYCAKRWCFTINFKANSKEEECEMEEDEISKIWGTPADGPQVVNHDDFEYIICQRERGENGTLHWQGFLILKQKNRLSWLKRHFSERAHFEVARGSDQQCVAYCRKEETYEPGKRTELWEMLEARGMHDENEKEPGRWEYGHLPERVHKKRQEKEEDAEDELENIKAGYKRPSEIDGAILRCPGFIAAYNALTADILGPYRPNLKIITLVGPPGTGKSYAIQKCFPEHGRCIYGNSGAWFQNPTAKVMIFEEFNGQIPLQRMLQMLDPYPLALEVKGRMAPAMYDTVVITSNTSPASWYPIKPQDEIDQGDLFKRKVDSIHALWDRIGYSNGAYVPVRKCGTYLEAPSLAESIGVSAADYIQGCRAMFYRELLKACDLVEDISDISESEDPMGPYTTDDDH